MSAPITSRLLRLRRTTTLHHFSTTPNNPPINPQTESEPESPFKSIKATLQNQSRTNPYDSNQQTHFQNQPRNNFYQQNQPPHSQNRSRFNFSQQSSFPRTDQSEALQKVTQNLAQFRARTSPPIPSSSSPSINISSFLKNSNTNTKPLDTSFLKQYSPNLMKQDGNLSKGGFGLGEMGGLLKGNVGGFRGFPPSNEELGAKLRGLRPEKRIGEWFSLQEMSDRLARLRDNEKKEMERLSGEGKVKNYIDIRNIMGNMKTDDEKMKERTGVRLDVLRNLGGTPSYMMYPPKEELLEQYFHPDNMSSAEKMKLELKKVRDEFKMSESDCGSARVQVAQLTTKIKHLSTVLAKKDKHSRKGLQEMVQKRKKLLKYLRRTDWDSYSLVLSKLGLRDNPEVKAELVKNKENKNKDKKNKKKKNKKKVFN